MLELWLFGSVQATLAGSPLQLPTRKSLALLAYLAVEGGTHHRDALATLLWPEQHQAQALASLRQALYALRRSLPEGLVEGDRHALSVTRDALWIDLWAFDASVRAVPRMPTDEVSNDDAARLEQAAALYRGDVMHGFTLRDCPDFDAWQVRKADAYRQTFQGVLRTLVTWYADERDPERAIEHGRTLLRLDPYDQAEHRRLMLLLALAGREATAIRQYETLVTLLATELGIEPDDETKAVHEAIKRHDVDALVRRGLAGATPSGIARRFAEPPRDDTDDTVHALPQRGRSNLPPQPTDLVGRQQDLRDLDALLANPAARMITIVAPGGMGKTRLAMAVAERQVAKETFADGVFFVPLPSVRTVGFLAQAVADAMDIKLLGRDDPARQLARHLSGRSVLLVLDGVEHASSAGGLVSELLARAPDVKVLVTSRERLHVQEEWFYQLWGMDVPTDALDVDDLRTFGAVELFERCAMRADPHFDLGRNGQDAVRICRYLQGMPLGIELAAAWVTTIPCKDIADEIDRDRSFLESRASTVADRHRSLEAVCEYAWHQLSEAARSVFQKLSVFRGGFTRQAAEQVAGASLPILAALADRALIRLRGSGRYEIHELLRQFAQAKLEVQPNAYREAERAQAMYCADMLAELTPDLKSARQFEALDDIAADMDNVMSTWAWAIRHRDVETIGKLAMGFFLYCEMRGLAQVGNEVLQRAIDAMEAWDGTDEGAAATLATLLVGQGVLRTRMGHVLTRLRRDRPRVLRSLAVHDPLTYVYAVHWFATVLPYEGKHAEADALLDRAETIARGADDPISVAWLLQTRGHNRYIEGRFLEAEPFFAQCMTAFDASGDRKFKALGLNNWARTAMDMGDYERAASLNAQGLAIRTMANDPLGTAASLIVQGRLKTRLGEYPRAQRSFDQAASLMEQSNNYQYWWMLRLDELQLDIALGHHERAYERIQQSRPNHGNLTDPYSEVQRLNGSAHLTYLRHDHTVARSLLQRSLATSAQLGHSHNEASALHHLGFVDLAEGDRTAARDHFTRSLSICRMSGAAPLALAVLIGWSELEAGAKKLALLTLVDRDARATHHTRETARKQLRELAPAGGAHLDVLDLWTVVSEVA